MKVTCVCYCLLAIMALLGVMIIQVGELPITWGHLVKVRLKACIFLFWQQH